MKISEWFQRSKTSDCILFDEVPDGMPVIEGEIVQLPLDGDMFVDRHLGQSYTRVRDTRPIKLSDGKTTKSYWLIARRAGAACGLVMLHEEVDYVVKVAGQTVNMKTDELVLKLWTDPALNYNVQDNEGLKSLTKQNLLGFEKFMLLFGGIILGWFVIGPAVNFLVSIAIQTIINLVGRL
jgi:hypothetical protein